MSEAAELANYQEQLEAINSALQEDSTNEELLAVKTELLELIELTETFLAQQNAEASPTAPAVPAPTPKPATPATTAAVPSSPQVPSKAGVVTVSTSVPAPKPSITQDPSTQRPSPASPSLYQPQASTRVWAAGDKCRALFAEDGKFYEATILAVGGAKGTEVYSVQFKGYADSPPATVDRKDLRPRFEKKTGGSGKQGEGEEEETGKRKAEHHNGSTATSTGVPGSGTKAKKPKLSNQEQLQKQKAWQSFAKGGKKGGKSAGTGLLQKKSIFATPDNPEGKVGVVGSGKGMTQFQQRGKHIYDNAS